MNKRIGLARASAFFLIFAGLIGHVFAIATSFKTSESAAANIMIALGALIFVLRRPPEASSAPRPARMGLVGIASLLVAVLVVQGTEVSWLLVLLVPVLVACAFMLFEPPSPAEGGEDIIGQ